MEIASILVELFSNINIIFYIVGYLVGGIPFGYLIVKLNTGKNLLNIGSGSTGATNVYRAMLDYGYKKAKIASLFTIILDATKGLIVILIAKYFGASYDTQWMIAFLSIIGHCYSPFLSLHGGKGVATAIGNVILLIPIEGILGILVWVIVGKVFKISSISSLLGIFSIVVFSFIIPNAFNLPVGIDINKQIGTHAPIILIGIFIMYTHWDNIIRIFSGKETKLDFGKKE